MEALTFDELSARALGAIDALRAEAPGLGVVVVLVQPLEPIDQKIIRYAAHTTLDDVTAAEILSDVAKGWTL